MRRPNWSALPPGAKATTIFTGRLGHSSARECEAGHRQAMPTWRRNRSAVPSFAFVLARRRRRARPGTVNNNADNLRRLSGGR
jgi:hypothetical protein